MFRDTPIRTIFKATSWRIMGSLMTSVVVYILTRRWGVALAVGGIEALTKIAGFYFHERLWDRIHLGKRLHKPVVLWFTGLSGAGKTTLAELVVSDMKRRNILVEHLDGDTIRSLFPNTGFSREEREEHIKRVAFLASRLEKNGLSVVVSLISPYQSSRQFARNLCSNFVEIHVATPLAECEKRDVKGLYKKARKGEIGNFTGVSDPYEEPQHPEVIVDTTQFSLQDSSRKVLHLLRKYL